jgi:hypothetical protein
MHNDYNHLKQEKRYRKKKKLASGIKLTSPNTAKAFSRSSLLTQGVKFFTFTAAL